MSYCSTVSIRCSACSQANSSLSAGRVPKASPSRHKARHKSCAFILLSTWSSVIVSSVMTMGSISMTVTDNRSSMVMVVNCSHNRSWMVMSMDDPHNRRRGRIDDSDSWSLWNNQNITRWEVNSTSRGKQKNQCQEKNFILHNETPCRKFFNSLCLHSDNIGEDCQVPELNDTLYKGVLNDFPINFAMNKQ